MTYPATPTFSLPTAQYLSKAAENITIALDDLGSEPVSGDIQALLRFHYLKLHPVTGEPMLPELINLLYDHLAEFCLKASRLDSAQYSHEFSALQREARQLLRKHKTGGEAGEILAYFLVEAVIGAPQLVAKMDLKTSTKMESLGADGLHFKWNDRDRALDIYSLESKLEDQASDAISNLVTSLEKFHLNDDYLHELRLATAHFKYQDAEMQDAVLRVLRNQEPGVTYRFRHACLAGYDWRGYSGLMGRDVRERVREFRERYQAQKPRLRHLIEKHFPRAVDAAGPLVAFDVFFLPFESVQKFRSAFNEAVR